MWWEGWAGKANCHCCMPGISRLIFEVSEPYSGFSHKALSNCFTGLCVDDTVALVVPHFPHKKEHIGKSCNVEQVRL